MNGAQRKRLLPLFVDDDRCHLAFARHEPGTDDRLGVNYHRPIVADAGVMTTALNAAGTGSSMASRIVSSTRLSRVCCRCRQNCGPAGLGTSSCRLTRGPDGVAA